VGNTNESRTESSVFIWKDYSRFVEVRPVRTGWLIVWGRYEKTGAETIIAGQRTYRDLEGVRRRLATAVLDLTGKPPLVADALALFARHPFPPRDLAPLPDPL